jgi:hypothetical protein
MKTLKETRIEMETTEDIFYCPVDPKDENSEYAIVVTKTERLDEFEMSVAEAAGKLGVSEKFLDEIISALRLGMHNVSEDLRSCWLRMDELEKRIKELEE